MADDLSIGAYGGLPQDEAGSTYAPKEPPKVSTKAEIDALAPGTEFLDPTGTRRSKPYQVSDARSYKEVPEGGTFLDPTGTARTKPTYEPLDYWPQTLIDAAHGNERQIEAILQGEYGKGNVKREPLTNEFYIEKDGKKYKPGKASVKAALANLTAIAAPVGLSTAGAVLGGTGGSLVPGAGTAAGGVGGAILGGAAGEAFNQSILGLAGYPTNMEDYAKSVIKEALYAGGGQAAGGIIGKGIGAAADATGNVNNLLKSKSSFLASVLGAQPEDTSRALRLAEQGVKVPPSTFLKEAPYLKKVEEFDKIFRQQDVFKQSAKAYYDKTAPTVMRGMGVEAPPSLTDATAPVSVEPFGAAMLKRAQTNLAAADTKFDQAVNAARNLVRQRGGAVDMEARAATLQALQVAQQEARTAAQAVVNNGFRSIDADVQNAIKTAQADGNPGDLVRLADEKINALRKAVGARATKMYDAADVAAGDIRPDVTGLKAQADDFLAQVPEEFKSRYPGVVAQIAKMKQGATFGQMHELRSMLRSGIDYNDLTPGVRSGALKNFVGKINGVLFDKEAPPALQEAAALLKEADTFYAQNIAKFKSNSLTWAIGQLEAGVPADASVLAAKFLQPGQTEEIRMVRGVVGKPLWSAVQAADTKAMLDQSKTLVPGEVDGTAFAKQVLQRERDGILGAAYDPATAQALRDQAQRVLLLEGKIPMETRPGDTVVTLLRRADSIGAEIKMLAERDPVKLLGEEMKTLDREVRRVKAQAGRQRRANPLYFLENPSAGAIESANKILNKPDLILSVARQFGEQSPEFEMLRQVWTTRLFQRSIGDTSRLAAEFSESITPEIQQLMFPGVSLDAAKQLAKDMEFLLPSGGTDFGGSMAGASRVLHPVTDLPIARQAVKAVPFQGTVGRLVLGNYYKLVLWGASHPRLIQYVNAGLKGSPQMQEFARQEFQSSYQKWLRGLPAGIGAMMAPDSGGETPVMKRSAVPSQKSWRDLYKERYQ